MILLRHGQSEFNLHFGATRRDPGIIDPRLTELGHAQAEGAAQQLVGQGIERIIVSPYTRALQTARPVAAALGVPVVVDPIVRERYAFACDVGSSACPGTRMAGARFWADRRNLVAARGRARDVRGRPRGAIPQDLALRHDWANTLVVSHWGFILTLTGQSVANGQWLRCDPNEPAPEHLVWRA